MRRMYWLVTKEAADITSLLNSGISLSAGEWTRFRTQSQSTASKYAEKGKEMFAKIVFIK